MICSGGTTIPTVISKISPIVRGGRVTQQELRSLRIFHGLICRQWEIFTKRLSDIERRIKAGASVEPGPESYGAIAGRVAELVSAERRERVG